jgi:hypothetical protein
MHIQYSLECLSREPRRAITLSKEEFDEIRRAKKLTLQLLSFEDKFDILLGNFLEFEQELLRLSTRRMLSPMIRYSEGQDLRHLLNRRLINLLSSARLYVDQTKHEISEFEGFVPNLRSILDTLFSNEYDGKLAYRAMEALRNFTQHRGLPVQGMNFCSSLEKFDTGSEFSFRVAPHLVLEELEGEGGLKKSVLDELKIRGRNYPLLPLVRGYIESMGLIHTKIRALLAPWPEGWNEVMEKAMALAREGTKDTVFGVHLVAFDQTSSEIKREALFKELYERVKELQEKNSVLSNLSKRFVSSRHIEGDV